MVLDADFEEWEAYASAGRFGFPEPARIVFRCRTNPRLRPRVVDIDGDRTKAEELVLGLSANEFVALLGRAEEVA